MESLLALIEFKQYKSRLIEDMALKTGEYEVELDIEWPENVPESDIVYDDIYDHLGNIAMFRVKAYKLYEKYIETGTEFEINISYESKVKIENKFKMKKNEWNANELVQIFDDVIVELVKLLKYSKKRFRFQKI